MTLICSEGHSEHDKQAAFASFSGWEISRPKMPQNGRKVLTPAPHTTRSPNGAYRLKKARK